MALQFLQGLYKKKARQKKKKAIAKCALADQRMKLLATYWYHNVLLGIPLNLVMRSEGIRVYLKVFEAIELMHKLPVSNHRKEEK